MVDAAAHRTADLWREHAKSVLRYLRRRLPTREEAEDLTQETFLRLHREQPALEDGPQVRAWLFRTAHNLMVDAFRSRREETSIEEIELAAEQDPGASLRKLEPCMARVSARLPETYRWALLWDLDGVPQQEIARRQKVSISGAKSRVQRARGLLQVELERCCHFRFDHGGVLLGTTPKFPGACS